MNQILTTGIILGRIDYGEADRILTVLTPDQGKLRLMAKGVRRIKSKLAGGIELFSVSQITFIRGKGEIGTLVGTRLQKHYGNIVQDIERVQLGYELIKMLDKATEDEPEAAYFELLQQGFSALDDAVELSMVRLWFQAQLLRRAGNEPNLTHDITGANLQSSKRYEFSFDDTAFRESANGKYGAGDIKLLRLLLSDTSPQIIGQVTGVKPLLAGAQAIIGVVFTYNIE